jgi:hypothetical protein
VAAVQVALAVRVAPVAAVQVALAVRVAPVAVVQVALPVRVAPVAAGQAVEAVTVRLEQAAPRARRAPQVLAKAALGRLGWGWAVDLS